MTDGQIQMVAIHFRKFEIEQIAKEAGATIVYMKPVPEDNKKKRQKP